MLCTPQEKTLRGYVCIDVLLVDFISSSLILYVIRNVSLPLQKAICAQQILIISSLMGNSITVSQDPFASKYWKSDVDK